MLLSIITVNLNNAKGLHKTMQSVLTQEFNDFEQIIIDGASTDNSLDVIRQFEGKIKNLTFISEPDSGVYQAMNRGIQIGTGDYLLFLNSGDFLVQPTVISNVFKLRRVADILCGRCNISKKGTVVHTTNPPPRITFGHLYTVGLAHQSTFIRRELFLQYGLYREDFRYNADIDFWYRTIVLNTCTTDTLDFVISDYNLDGISFHEQHSERYQNEICEILAHPIYQSFIPDYEANIHEKQEMKLYYWFKSKTFLHKLLIRLFNFVTWFVKMKKHEFKRTNIKP